MLIFLDETFRTRKTKTGDLPFGAMCGVAIRETDLTRVANDVFKLKQKHLGDAYAREKEIKAKVPVAQAVHLPLAGASWTMALRTEGDPANHEKQV